MGKWETNIGNTIKDNSAGRVIIGGVAKKVSVVREVVNGIVKQVWNAFDPYIGDGSVRMTLSQSYQSKTVLDFSAKVSEAVANGYTRIAGNYYISWSNLATPNTLNLGIPYTSHNPGSLFAYTITNDEQTDIDGSISGSFNILLSQVHYPSWRFVFDAYGNIYDYGDATAYASVSNVRFE